MNNDMIITPLADDEGFADYPMDKFFNPVLPSIKRQKGTLTVILAATNSGKTVLINNLLFKFWRSKLKDKPTFDTIHFYSPTVYNDPSSRYFREYCEVGTRFTDEVLDNLIEEANEYETEDRPRNMLIIDDHLGLIKSRGKSKIASFFSRMRHYNYNCLISLQYYKDLHALLRPQIANMVIMNVNSDKESLKLAEEMGGIYGGAKIFLEMLKYATRDRYCFLYLKMRESPPEAYKNFTEKLDWQSKLQNTKTVFDSDSTFRNDDMSDDDNDDIKDDDKYNKK